MGLYPQEPLPLVSEYPSLFVTDRAYLKPNEGDVYIYPTAEAAIMAEDGEGSIGTVDKGYVYLRYGESRYLFEWCGCSIVIGLYVLDQRR